MNETVKYLAEEVVKLDKSCKAGTIDCLHCSEWSSKAPRCHKPFDPLNNRNHLHMCLEALNSPKYENVRYEFVKRVVERHNGAWEILQADTATLAALIVKAHKEIANG